MGAFLAGSVRYLAAVRTCIERGLARVTQRGPGVDFRVAVGALKILTASVDIMQFGHLGGFP